MAEKTSSYLSSVKEVNNETNSISANKELNKKIIEVETQKAVKCALRKDYEQALDIFESIENREMVLVIKKCIELEPIFEQFLNGQISYGQYKKISKRFPEESKEIVQFKYPDLEFIEIQNLERKFREKIEGIIDELLAKNTLESLIEARKIYEKHMGIIKKPYNFDRLFIKTISFIPYSQLKPLYKIEWTDVEKLINEYLLNEANSFTKAEKILKEIKVIEANRDTIQIIIRNFNKQLDIKLRQNYRENKLRQFVREYKAHSFYQLERNNKITTKIEPYFLQRRIYAIYYVNENADLFLDMLKNQIDVLYAVPYENQRTYYHAIIRSLRLVRDY